MTLFENRYRIYLPELKVSQEKLFLANYVYRGSRFISVNCNLHEVIKERRVKVDITSQKFSLVEAISKFFTILSHDLIKLENQIVLLLKVPQVLPLLWNEQIHLGNTKYSQSEPSFWHFCECILTCFVPEVERLFAKLIHKLVFEFHGDLHLRYRYGLASKYDPTRLENLFFVN